MKRSSLYLLVMFMLTLSMVSCDDGFDMQRPTVAIQSPVAWQTVNTADGIPLKALFTDNGNLLQYRMVLEGIDSLNGIARDTTLRRVIINGISGSVFELDERILLPDSIFNGYYRIILSCIDDDGNESYPDSVPVRVVNVLDSVPPAFSIEGIPAAQDTLRLGMGFVLGGTITDETSLNFASVRIASVDGPFVLHDFKFANIINNTVDFSSIGWWFPVDTTWAEGRYRAYFTAWDNHNGADHELFFEVRH